MIIGVIGPSECSGKTEEIAEEVGREIVKAGAILLCGGLGGVMEASSRGAKSEKGLTVGILPGFSPSEANKYIDIPIVTGLSESRNFIIVRSSDAIIAIEGGYGTLSEIAIAMKLDVPVIGLNTWDVSKKIICVKSPKEAVEKAIKSAKRRR